MSTKTLFLRPPLPGSGSPSHSSHRSPAAPGLLSSIHSPSTEVYASTQGAKPDGPLDLLADAEVFREKARAYAAQGIWSLSGHLDRLSVLTEQMAELMKARRGLGPGKGVSRESKEVSPAGGRVRRS